MLKRKFSRKKGVKRAPKRQKLFGGFGYGPVGGGRGGRGITAQTISWGPVQAPDRSFVKLQRTLTGFETATSGVFNATSILNVNSCFDPLGTTGTGQPTGSGPLLGTTGSLYSSYIVHACKVDVQAVGDVIGTILSLRFRVNNSAQANGISQQQAMPHTLNMFLSTNATISKRSMFRTMAQVSGQSPNTVAIADSYSALYNANPSSLCVCDIGVGSTGTTTCSAYFTIRLTQWVELFGRITNS